MREGSDLAGYWSRVGATLLDGLVVGVVVFVVLLLAAAAGASDDSASTVVIISAVLSSLLYAPALMCRKGEHNGQTLGKQAAGIRVVREDAQPIGAPVALMREFVGKGLLGLIPFYTIVDYLLPLSDRRSQAIHDKVATTFVVRADAVPDLGHRAGEPPAPGAPAGWAPPTSSPPQGWAPPGSPAPEGWAPPTPRPSREPVDLSAWARPPAPPEPARAGDEGHGAEAPRGAEPPTAAGDDDVAPPTAPPRDPDDDEPVRGPFGPS